MTRLQQLLAGNAFRYSDLEWGDISKSLPPSNYDLRTDLECVANEYLALTATSQTSEYVLAEKKRASAAAIAAENFLSAIAKDGLHPSDYGLDVTAWNQAYETIRIIAADERATSESVGSAIAGRDFKKIRRRFIESLIILWHCHIGMKLPQRRLPKESLRASELLDFIDRASRPVLTPGDRFGGGAPGRDQLRKVVSKIRSEGFQSWNEAFDELYHLST